MHKLPTAGLRLILAIATLSSAAPARAVEPGPGPGDVPRGVYLLDPQRSQLVANLRFFGVSRYPVSFSGMAGRMENAQQVASGPRVTIRVDPRSINNPRSVVARSMLTLLEPERFPQISFTSRTLGDANGQMWLLGDLTLHGVTRPVRLTLAIQHMEPGPGGPARFAVSGRGRIRRSEFGMSAVHAPVGDQVDLSFQAQFVQAPADAGERQARSGPPDHPEGSDGLE